jgi:superfamily I DNA/RNA helicase
VKPTPEQIAAVDASVTGDNLTIEAGAGTGKTSTLRLISEASPTKRILYLAYNAAIARESARTFPENTECRTAHSVAYRWTARQWGNSELRARLSSARMPSREVARILGSSGPVRVSDDLVLAPERIASIAMQTVQRWCYTGDERITDFHVPEFPRIDSDDSRMKLADAVVPLAHKAWADLSRPDGRLRFQHDHYLKFWALHRPTLEFDFVLVDEAQDSNGVVTSVVRHQTAQVAAVGDRCQSIYAWRGATDAMDAFGSKHHVFLTKSFRFGPAIAEEANKWLEILGSELKLVGTPAIDSKVDMESETAAVLCRTNAEAISTVIACHAAHRKVALIGDGREVASFARAAQELMDRGSTSHPELFTFVSWGQVREYVEEAYDGGELKVLVRLIDDYGPQGVINAIEGCADEKDAEVVVSTAHKAKGREWDSVRIADDFGDEAEALVDVSGPECMLAYVAVTRARSLLNRKGLAWIDGLLEAVKS